MADVDVEDVPELTAADDQHPLGAIGLAGLLIAGLWLIGLPGEDEEEELAGLVTANWDEVKSRIDDG